MSSRPASRNDGTLIQIDTVGDWERLQSNFTDAIEGALDAQLGPTASLSVRDALRQHLVHVSQPHLTNVSATFSRLPTCSSGEIRHLK